MCGDVCVGACVVGCSLSLLQRLRARDRVADCTERCNQLYRNPPGTTRMHRLEKTFQWPHRGNVGRYLNQLWAINLLSA